MGDFVTTFAPSQLAGIDALALAVETEGLGDQTVVGLAELEGGLVAEGFPSEQFSDLMGAYHRASNSSDQARVAKAIAELIRREREVFERILPRMQLRAHRFGSGAQARATVRKQKPHTTQPWPSLGQRAGVDVNGSAVMMADGGNRKKQQPRRLPPPVAFGPPTSPRLVGGPIRIPSLRPAYDPSLIRMHYSGLLETARTPEQAIAGIEKAAAEVWKWFRGEGSWFRPWFLNKVLKVTLENEFSIEIVGSYQYRFYVTISFDLSRIPLQSREEVSTRVRRLLESAGYVLQDSGTLAIIGVTNNIHDALWLSRLLEASKAVFTFDPKGTSPTL